MLLSEMVREPTSYRPTEHQRAVLAKIAIADTPQLGFDQIARGVKLNTAAQSLAKLGFISILDGEASLTDAGEQLAVAQALIDEGGSPTDQAREVASSIND